MLARGVEGYHRLAGGDHRGPAARRREGPPALRPGRAGRARPAGTGDPDRLPQGCGPAGARRRRTPRPRPQELDRLTALFGHDQVVVELIDHGLPDRLDDQRPLAELARDHGLPVVATNNVHYATPQRRPAGQRDGRRPGPPQPGRDGRLAAGAGRAPAVGGGDGARSSPATPARCERTRRDGRRAAPSTCGWPSRGCPSSEVPPGHTPISWLRELCRRGADERYPAPARDRRGAAAARSCAVIEEKDFPGYFLIVHDMVDFARERGILCQGRGSAANSVVCYVLGITAVDPILYDLPFERFLSAHPRRGARHRRRLRLRPARGGDPGGLPALRPAQRRPGGQRDQLPAEVGGPRHGQGARLLHRPAGRLVQADRLLAVADRRRAETSTTSRRRWSSSPTSCWGPRATWASTPAGWC